MIFQARLVAAVAAAAAAAQDSGSSTTTTNSLQKNPAIPSLSMSPLQVIFCWPRSNYSFPLGEDKIVVSSIKCIKVSLGKC